MSHDLSLLPNLGQGIGTGAAEGLVVSSGNALVLASHGAGSSPQDPYTNSRMKLYLEDLNTTDKTQLWSNAEEVAFDGVLRHSFEQDTSGVYDTTLMLSSVRYVAKTSSATGISFRDTNRTIYFRNGSGDFTSAAPGVSTGNYGARCAVVFILGSVVYVLS